MHVIVCICVCEFRDEILLRVEGCETPDKVNDKTRVANLGISLDLG